MLNKYPEYFSAFFSITRAQIARTARVQNSSGVATSQLGLLRIRVDMVRRREGQICPVVDPDVQRSRGRNHLTDLPRLKAEPEDAGVRFAGEHPVADDEGIGTLLPRHPVCGQRAGNANQRLEHQAHPVVDGVHLAGGGVAALGAEGEGPRLQNHGVALRGLEADFDAERVEGQDAECGRPLVTVKAAVKIVIRQGKVDGVLRLAVDLWDVLIKIIN